MLDYTTRPMNPVEALEAVEALTLECRAIMRAIEAAAGTPAARPYIERMQEVNETRMRIIEDWRLETEARALIRRLIG